MSRAEAIVVRNGRILMVRHQHPHDSWWCLPGGAIEPGETGAEAALRELREECGVEGTIVAPTGVFLRDDERHETFHVDIGDGEPRLGADPELDEGQQILADLAWLRLAELSERDRVFLWTSGLLAVPGILDEVERWPREPSDPVRRPGHDVAAGPSSPVDPARVEIRAISSDDGGTVVEKLTSFWGATAIARRGELIDAAGLPGFLARRDDEIVGLVTCLDAADTLEIVTINTFHRRAGIGRQLVEAVVAHARKLGRRRVVAITTNDNVNAATFYQKVGFRLRAVFPDGIESARALKPSIPDTGQHGIAIRDELRFEREVDSKTEVRRL